MGSETTCMDCNGPIDTAEWMQGHHTNQRECIDTLKTALAAAENERDEVKHQHERACGRIDEMRVDLNCALARAASAERAGYERGVREAAEIAERARAEIRKAAERADDRDPVWTLGLGAQHSAAEGIRDRILALLTPATGEVKVATEDASGNCEAADRRARGK